MARQAGGGCVLLARPGSPGRNVKSARDRPGIAVDQLKVVKGQSFGAYRGVGVGSTTANGTVSMSLEDETGLLNIIIWRRTWERFRKVAKDAVALHIKGKVERAGSSMFARRTSMISRGRGIAVKEYALRTEAD